jgi:uncharacterized protein
MDKRYRTKKELNHAMFSAASFGNTSAVIKFLKQGANPNYTEDMEGYGAIHYAARWGDNRMIRALIHYGANINILTREKESALHKATAFNRIETVMLLMSKGARSDVRSAEGKKPSDLTKNQELIVILDNWKIYTDNMMSQRKAATNTRTKDSYNRGQ